MVVNNWIQVNSVWIALAVSILVLGGLGYYIVKRRRLGALTIFLTVWGLLFFYYIVDITGLSKSNQLSPADWAQIWGQILLLGGLLVVTAAYAYSTEKMAEEMREQRYAECLPILTPDIIRDWDTRGLEPNEVPHIYLQSGIGIKIILSNVGKGVAINSRFSLWTAPFGESPVRVKFFPSRESEVLGVGDQKEISFHDRLDGQLLDIPKAYHPRLIAKYQDIYERKITTVQEFRIVDENQHKRAFIGELYFVINGKRLGEEVTK